MAKDTQTSDRQTVVGIIPMAGQAKRLNTLHCSKEIHPIACKINDYPTHHNVVCEHLLQKMQAAHIHNIYIILRDGKWDIPSYLGNGSQYGLNLAYLMMGLPYGTPYSTDQAYSFVKERIVAFGFPDMLFDEQDLFTPLLAHMQRSKADLVLGTFPANRPDKTDVIEMADDYAVKDILIKPSHTALKSTWGIAVWQPTFTEFMHNYLAKHQSTASKEPELFIGDVIRAGLSEGLRVHAVDVSKKPFLDIGTQEDLDKIKPR